LADVAVGAAEIRSNAARGFRAVSFPEFPAQLGYPSIFTEHWDPIFAACQETDTVICLHTGASAWAPLPSPDPPFELLPTVFPVNALLAAGEWLWSGVAVRFPDIKVAFSEGGIGWVPMLMDRADYVLDHSASGRDGAHWKSDRRPSEIMGRNFWYCTIDDPSITPLLDRIGPGHVMVESDYPHADSSWPDTQQLVHDTFGHLPTDRRRMITAGNAAELFRHPLPGAGDWRDPPVIP
jgi:predicted TIM-barrel fold metal-dependent hydrolase